AIGTPCDVPHTRIVPQSCERLTGREIPDDHRLAVVTRRRQPSPVGTQADGEHRSAVIEAEALPSSRRLEYEDRARLGARRNQAGVETPRERLDALTLPTLPHRAPGSALPHADGTLVAVTTRRCHSRTIDAHGDDLDLGVVNETHRAVGWPHVPDAHPLVEAARREEPGVRAPRHTREIVLVGETSQLVSRLRIPDPSGPIVAAAPEVLAVRAPGEGRHRILMTEGRAQLLRGRHGPHADCPAGIPAGKALSIGTPRECIDTAVVRKGEELAT